MPENEDHQAKNFQIWHFVRSWGTIAVMIKKVVKKTHLKNSLQGNQDLAFWLSKPPQERVAAVDHLRFQIYGNSIRLQRSVRVIQQTSD